MKKRMLALGLVLALSLSLTPAMAAGTADKFPATQTYAGFSDVSAAASNWSYAYIKACYETGIMNGVGKGETFNPGGVMKICEAAAIAARLGSTLTGKAIEPSEAPAQWYTDAMTYMHRMASAAGDEALADVLSYPEEDATRNIFFALLSLALPQGTLGVKNSITALPDASGPALLAFYNAGVLSGVNDYGTFAGGKSLTRSEAAAMVARIVRPELAVAFTPKAYGEGEDLMVYLAGYPSATPYLTADETPISLGDYFAAYYTALEAVYAMCQAQGVTFDWKLTIDEGPLEDYLEDKANTTTLKALWQADHGNDSYDTSAYLGAKHILISNEKRSDAEALAEANRIRALLTKAGDSAAEFDKLMNAHSEDGRTPDGALGAPTGYTFTDGDMVAEFETAAKALTVGKISAPIKSEFGYHIILRTAPNAEEARAALAAAAFEAWYKAVPFYRTDITDTIYLPGVCVSYESLMQ